MTDTYPHMNKINDLASELIKELTSRKNSIYQELSYAAYCEIGDEIAYLVMRGWDEESAKDKASDNLERYREENGHETPYDDELKTIENALKLLKALTMREA